VPLSDDLDRLDQQTRQLHAKWDMFFSGVEKKPPTELQSQVEKLIRQYAFSEIRNNTERFRYQSLTARYNTFNELWQKRLRAREEGKAFGVHGLRADALPPPSPAPPRAAPPSAARAGGAGGEYRVGDPDRDAAAVRALYEQYVSERRRMGEGGAPAFDSFRRLIGQQTAKILSKGARAVDFRLDTKGGKVSLKARLVK
jgi:hypothetical protein